MGARIAIAGGGPSGLMVARLLAEDGHHVDVFEANGEIGGLCRSKTVDGYVFDLAGGGVDRGGGHRAPASRGIWSTGCFRYSCSSFRIRVMCRYQPPSAGP